VARRANLPELDLIIERAAALQAVIFQHTWIKTNGNLPGESSPMDLAELARRHPAVPFQLTLGGICFSKAMSALSLA